MAWPKFSPLTPQIDPSYRPSLSSRDGNGASVPPFAVSDLILSPAQWSGRVVGKISSWIDLDSEDDVVRSDSEITLKQEVAWASHLSLQVTGDHIIYNCAVKLWIRIPIMHPELADDGSLSERDGGHVLDTWLWWNSFRLLCEHHSQIFVALDIMSSLPSTNSTGR